MRKPVIELTVNNHPGVMSHIAGLFARRAFNIEGIRCVPLSDGQTSRMYLLVAEDEKLLQLIKQLEKLYDVLEVSVRDDCDHNVFDRLHETMKRDEP